MTDRPALRLEAPRRGKPPLHFADLSPEGRVAAVVDMGHPAFRAKQVLTHYFSHLAVAADEMTDLPVESREELVAFLFPTLLRPVLEVKTDRGKTIKSVWALDGGAWIESVLMAYKDRVTLCVTSQAGCGMNCPFCATGQMGLTRNLSAAEIIEQVRLAARACRDGAFGKPIRLSNVVFMGMGEPLANYGPVLTALRTIIAPPPTGFGLSARHITLSTVGLVPRIDKFAGEGLPVTLALSLHAPDDGARDELVPMNSRWKVDEVLDAAKRYFDTTGRRVSIEYALMRGKNDQGWRADLLAEKLLARGRGWVHVNPIPLNPTPGSEWTASTLEDTQEFVRRLEAYAIPTTIRDTRGSDIDGACGQLAIKEAT